MYMMDHFIHPVHQINELVQYSSINVFFFQFKATLISFSALPSQISPTHCIFKKNNRNVQLCLKQKKKLATIDNVSNC